MRNKVGLGLILLFIVVYLLPLNLRPLSIPDEMRYGEIAREMLETGNFISPRLNGLRYFEKPAGGHALNAAAMALFGETNFAVRLMSALVTGLAALALFGLVKLERGRSIAALATFIFLTCAEVMAVGTFSVLDAMVTCFITLTLCSFYPALETTGAKRAGWLALTGVFAGGAFLIKGFIAFAVPVVVIVPYMLLQRRWKDLFILPWIPLVTAVLVSLPWSLAIAAQEPDFWRYFFWVEHIQRFFSETKAQHDNPIWYFVPVFIVGAIPWILIAVPPLRDLFRTRLKEPLVRYGLCWMVMPFLFFSASSGKLGTYILPCFVPFALLLAIALTDRFERNPVNRSVRFGVYAFTAIVAALLVTLVVAGGLDALHKLPVLDAHFTLKLIGALIGVIVALALLIKAIREQQDLQKTVLLGLSTAVVFVTSMACIPTETSGTIGIQGFLQAERGRVDANTILVGDSRTAHALCYEYKRDDVYLAGRMGEFEYGLTFPEAEHRYLELPQIDTLIRERGSHRVVLVFKASQGRYVKEQLPPPDYEVQRVNIWLAVYEAKTAQ